MEATSGYSANPNQQEDHAPRTTPVTSGGETVTSQTRLWAGAGSPLRVSMGTEGRSLSLSLNPAPTREGRLLVLVTVQVRSRSHQSRVSLTTRKAAASTCPQSAAAVARRPLPQAPSQNGVPATRPRPCVMVKASLPPPTYALVCKAPPHRQAAPPTPKQLPYLVVKVPRPPSSHAPAPS